MPPASTHLREHIVETSARLFYSEGIRGVGVDRVIASSGIAKATLYKHFAGKEELVVAYLESRHQRVIDAMRAGLPGLAGKSRRERALHLFRQLEDKAEHDEDFRGCAFLMAVAEHGSVPRITAVARRHKDGVREIFAALLDEGQAPALADQLALLYDGALAQIMIRRSSEPARTAACCAAALVAAGCEEHGG